LPGSDFGIRCGIVFIGFGGCQYR